MKTSYGEQSPSLGPRVDWGDALVVPHFYGRKEEQILLSQWITQEDCRVISVLGMGGIGKSALAVNIMHHLTRKGSSSSLPVPPCSFDVIIFRSLRDAPSCEALLDDCLQVLSPQPLSTLPTTLEKRLTLLLEYLGKARTLLVLDNLECLLEAEDVRSHFRPGYEEYGLLLHRVVETVHQSCLLFTSREKPAELRLLEGRYPSVRSLRLAGLDIAACQRFFVEKEVVGSQQEQESLIEVYTGNPLALKIVAETIADRFGSEISQFLAGGTVIFGSINELLDEQFARLSTLEQTVLCWLTIMREPGTLNELLALLVPPLPRRPVLLEAVDGLRRRSLVESGKHAGSFTLQSVVLEYVTAVLIAEGSHEIQHRRLNRLIQYGLSQAHAKEYVRQAQERLLVSPLLAELQCAYSSRSEIEGQLLGLLDELREQDDDDQGYGPANLIVLLRLLRGNLNDLVLSRLSIRSAYLQGIKMRDASFSGALIRDTVFTEAVNATWSVAISPDGRWWAAGSIQGQVRVWEERSQTLRLIWQAHGDIVYSLAFSPDGQTLASGSFDGTVKLWDVESGALLWMGWQRSVQSLAFTPDGSVLASGGGDATVQLWEMGSHRACPRGTALQTLRHASPVYAVAFSPDGHLLASGSADGQLRLWERRVTESCTYVEILAWQTNWVRALAFAPDGRTLGSAHMDPSDRTVKLWEVGSGQLLHTLPELQGRCIAWSPDGCVLASYCDKTIWLWDMEQGRIRSALHGHATEVYCLTFVPNKSQLLSGSADGMLRVWDVEGCRCVRVIAGYGVTIGILGWSPDSTHLVSGGTDGLVTIWAAGGEALPKVLRGHSWVVGGVGWSADGRLVVSCGWDRTIRLWDATTHTLVQIFEAQAMLQCMAWSPDGSLLACGTNRRGVQVWDMRTRSLRFVGQPYQTMFINVAWNPDGTRLASSSDDGSVYLWECAGGTLLGKLPGHHGWVFGAVWSPDGTRLASGSGGEGGGELFVWDVQSVGAGGGQGQALSPGRDQPGARPCPVQTFAGHSGQVHAVVWSPRGDRLISGDTDGMLRWWDVETAGCVSIRAAHQGTIRSLCVSPDGRRLASCGDDGAIKIWDLESFEYVRTLRHDRPYERLNITGIRGLNEAEIASLQALGAFEEALP